MSVTRHMPPTKEEIFTEMEDIEINIGLLQMHI